MTMPIAAGNEYVTGPGNTYGVDPAKLKFTKLTPDNVGLSSFEDVNRIPGLSSTDFQAVLDHLKQLDAAKAAGGDASPEYQKGVASFYSFYNNLISAPGRYVTPAAQSTAAHERPVVASGNDVAAVPLSTNGVTPAQTTTPTGDAVAAVPPPVVPPPETTPGLTTGMDINQKLIELLGPNSEPFLKDLEQMQLDYLKKGMAAPDFGPNDQAILDAGRQSAEMAAGQGRRTAEKEASAMGLRDSTYVVARYQGETDKLTQQLLDNESRVRVAAAGRGAAERQAAFDRVNGFRDAIANKNVALANALLGAYTADKNAQLDEKKLAQQQQIIDANVSLDRDKFSADEVQRMRAAGFTQQQIDNAQQQLLWSRAFQQTQQSADIDLGNKNYELQAKALNGQLTMAERQQALSELKNNQDQTLAEAIQAWKQKMDAAGIAADQRNYDGALRQFEMQFGLDLNKFALDAELRRGSLALQTLTADRENALQTRAAELADLNGLRGYTIDETKLALTKTQLEQEFKIQISDQELRRQIANGQLGIATGQLNLDILNSQRKYDLDVTAQKNDWLKSQAALALQEKLGMADIELRQVLGEGQLSVEREAQLLQKFMFEQGLSWEKEKFQKQIDEARRKAKGSFFGKLLKGLVGAGLSVAGALTGNPALVAAGINTIAGAVITQPSD